MKSIVGIRKKKWNPNIKTAVQNSRQSYSELCKAKEAGDNKEICRLKSVNKANKKMVRKAQRQASAESRIKLLNDISSSALTDSKKFNRLLKHNKNDADLPPILINNKLEFDEAECAKQWGIYHEKLATPMPMPHMDNEHLVFVEEHVKRIRTLLKSNDEKVHIRPRDIQTAIRKLKNGKSPDDDGIVTEHLSQGENVIELLYELYEKIANDNKVEDCLKTLIKFSLPKDPNQTHIQTRYRGIAISKLILKVFEHIILVKSHIENPTHNLQFGFTKGRGPDMASLCLSEALNQAADLKQPLIIISLDTMKAFDVVPHDFLLYRLYHRNTKPAIWKIIDSLLSGQTEKALWGAASSEYYPIKQGTGQGKVMGAPLFKIHIHPLLEQLTSLDIGFKIGNVDVGHPTCADDLLLIADSVGKAQALCDAVHIISRQDRSTQQPSKSRILCTDRNEDAKITLDEKAIPDEKFFKHVGINRYQKCNDDLISDRISTCRKTTYSLMPVGIHGTNGLSPFYIRKIIISHIMPRTIHGLHTITLTNKQRDSLDTAYITLQKTYKD